MSANQQNNLWKFLGKDTKKNMIILYNVRKSSGQLTGFLETLYGKSNLENEKI